jgi:hypothetical protein
MTGSFRAWADGRIYEMLIRSEPARPDHPVE